MGPNDTVETQDMDGDGYTTLQERLLDTNPTNATPGLVLAMGSNFAVTAQGTSPRRTYELQRTPTLAFQLASTGTLAGHWRKPGFRRLSQQQRIFQGVLQSQTEAVLSDGIHPMSQPSLFEVHDQMASVIVSASVVFGFFIVICILQP